jgi:hypothetical protein
MRTGIIPAGGYISEVLAECRGPEDLARTLTAELHDFVAFDQVFVAAQQQALGRLYDIVQTQAATLSYLDACWLLAGGGAISFFCSFLLKAKGTGNGGYIALE